MATEPFKKGFVWEVRAFNSDGEWTCVVVADGPREAFQIAVSANAWNIMDGISIRAIEAYFEGKPGE